jgi:diamine N-acetyltransferase
MTVSLREITAENVRAVCELEVAEDQRRLVAPASYTVAESAYEQGGLLRAINLDDAPVGIELCLAEIRGQGFEPTGARVSRRTGLRRSLAP